MKVSSSKEKILKKIREALSNPVPLPFPGSEGTNSIFPQPKEELEIIFAEEFTKLLGKFAFCVSEADMKLQVQQLISAKKWANIFCKEDQLLKIFNDGNFPKLNQSTLSECDAAVTTCKYLIARTGAIVIISRHKKVGEPLAHMPRFIFVLHILTSLFMKQEMHLNH